MDRQLRCPNCGGEHSLVNPGITMLVCDYCKTVVYWDDASVLKKGSQSILPESDSRLFLHATGKLLDREYEVVGHLRYDHGRGQWDEWYLQLADGGVAWLSEDQRELTLEEFLKPDPSLPPPDQLRAGLQLTLEGVLYSVREMGTARCVGGEGQLPFTVLPGEQYPFADLATPDGQRFATLEYDRGHSPHCFSGKVLDHRQLTIDEERPPSTAGAREGKHISCPNCAAPLELTTGREIQTLVCDYCGAQNDLSGAEARVLGINPKDFETDFAFEIGQGGRFHGQSYEVCGRMLYEDDEGYLTREYLLYNPEAGYLWLAEENGHYLLNRPTKEAPPRDPFNMATKQVVTIAKTPFQFYEQGTTRLTYVDGALPWLARVGDHTRYADLIAPPRIFSAESDGKEIEYFVGRYLPPEEVWRAFGVTNEAPPRAFGIHPAQPFARGPIAWLLMTIGGIFALINLALLLWSLTITGRPILEQTFNASDYLKEVTSNPFTVGKEPIMSMELFAPLNNSWLALDVALLDSNQRVCEEIDGEISYYQGVEGGESWSEGSRRNTTYFKAPTPGNYRLILKAAAGSGTVGSARGEPLSIRLYQGMMLSRYFMAALIITLLFPLLEIARKFLFEQRRWAPVIEDDDDD